MIDLFGFFQDDKIESTKVAVLKLGARISINSQGTSGGTGEALAIIDMLVQSGLSVDVYTKMLKGDSLSEKFNIYDIESNIDKFLNETYEALIVINGSVNFFGGQCDSAQILNYYFINKFNGPVYYILCDCNLLLKQIWPSIESKSWSTQYNKNDLIITRDDIVYISQPRNTDKLLDLANKYVKINKCVHFPFEKFPLLKQSYINFNNFPKYDVLYGGTFRNGRREDDMLKFYFGYPDNYKITMFGNININNFNNKKLFNLQSPTFEDSVRYDQFNDKMNESISTIIIGDKLYKKLDDLAQRIYESIQSKVVTFIDSEYDYNKRVFKDKELVNFLYVKDREQVMNRLTILKNDLSFRKHIIDLQINDTKINNLDYCNEFRGLLNI